MRLSALLMLPALALCLPMAQAWAGDKNLAEFDRQVGSAREQLLEKNTAACIKSLRGALATAWERLPFTVMNVHLAAAPPEGYGRYLPRVDNVYRPGEPLIIYMEPAGFKVNEKGGEPLYHYKLTADFNMVDAWGRVVSGRRSVGNFEGETRAFPDRYPLTFTYSLSGLPPGDYRVETIVHDLLGKKSHTVITPIRIQGP